MSQLDSTTTKKLAAFGRRQKALLLVRALCVAAVSFICLMSIVALIDWMWILSHGMRWALSLTSYALVAILVWQSSLRRWMQPTDMTQLAASFELAQPELREDLLSAVELSNERATGNGAAAFRQRLQQQVAQRIESANVRRLLPWGLIGTWLSGALALTVVFGTLLAIPGLSYRQLITRALAPGANLDRVSSTVVQLLQPSPGSQTVPLGETVGIVVQLDGPEVEQVVLDTSSQASGGLHQSMVHQGNREYRANVTVDGQYVDYRILAGDALTRTYRLESKPRPHAKAFQKTYRYPAYTQLPDETITDSSADLVALKGTTVQLVVGTDQTVRDAHVVIDVGQGEQLLTYEAKYREDGLLVAEVPIEKNGVMKIELTSAETGFTNQFSPVYEVRPLPDLVPRVAFVGLDQATLLSRVGDIIPLAVAAEDDMPLDTLQQWVSINGGKWQVTDLKGEPAANVSRTWELDLLAIDAKVDDLVSVKVVAIDRKGQRGETMPLRIVVASGSFDPGRLDAMIVKSHLADQLQDLADDVEVACHEADEIFDRNRKSYTCSQADQKQLVKLAGDVQQELDTAFQAAVALAAKCPVGIDAYDVEVVGQTLAMFKRQDWGKLNELLDNLASGQTDAKLAKQQYESSHRQFQLMGQQTRWLNDQLRTIYSQDLMSALAIDMSELYLQQQTLMDSARPVSDNRFQRQQEVAINYLTSLETILEQQEQRIRPKSRDAVRRLHEFVSSSRERIQQAIDQPESASSLRSDSEALYQNLKHQLSRSHADESVVDDTANARLELMRRAGTLADHLDLAIRAAQDCDQLRRKIDQAKDTTEVQKAQNAYQQASIEYQWRWQAVMREVGERKQLNESREDRNNVIAADWSLAQRAITHVLGDFAKRDESADHDNDAAEKDGSEKDESESDAAEKAPAEKVTDADKSDDAPKVTDAEKREQQLESMRVIRQALRQLEAGHGLLRMQPVATELLGNERWRAQRFASRIEGPRLWLYLDREIPSIAQLAKNAGYSDEFVGRVNDVRWQSHQANDLIVRRRWDGEIVSAQSSIEALVGRLNGCVTQAQPVMDEARRQLGALLPSIAHLAKQLAEKSELLAKQTAEATQAKEQPDKQAAEDQADKQAAEDQADEQTEKPTDEQADEQSDKQGDDELSPASDQALEALAEEQRSLDEQLRELLAALAEDAAKQDLMDQQQRERARDADDAIGMIKPPADAAKQQLQAAAKANDAQQQNEHLQQSAEQQQKLSEALKQVAEHFEKQDAGQDVEASRQRLRSAEAELPNARQLQQQYQQAERLSQLNDRATNDQEKLMQELEHELKTSPPMQRALSDIAAEATAQALGTLEHAKKREDEAKLQLLESDPLIAAKTSNVQQELRELAQLSRIAKDSLARYAEQAANLGGSNEAQELVKQAQQHLDKAQQTLNSDSRQTLDRLRQVAQDAKQSLQQAEPLLKKAAEIAQQASTQAMSTDEKQEQRRKSDMRKKSDEIRRSLDRELKSLQQQSEQNERNARNSAASSKQQFETARRDAEKADQEAKKYTDQWHQDHAAQKRREADEKSRVADAQQKLFQAAQMRKEAVLKQRDQLKRFNPLEGEHKNPAAKIAETTARQAATLTEQLSQAAKRIAESSPQELTQLDATEGKLGEMVRTQAEIGDTVNDASEDLSRASRHEQRMNRSPELAADLDQLAKGVADVSGQQVASAGEQAKRAHEQLRSGENKPDASNSQPSESAKTSQAIQQASDSIEGQAKQVADLLAKSQAAEQSQPDSPSAVAPAPASSDPSAIAALPGESDTDRGQRLAQMMDELDRAMATATGDDAQPSGQPSGEQTEPSSPASLSSINQLAAQQASQMGQQRAQSLGNPTPPAGNPLSAGPGQLSSAPGNLPGAEKINRDGNDWGKLREQSAEDTAVGKRSQFANQYSDQIKAYFKVIAERSQRN